jgi:uncharacterized Zn-binding protein involved in type VI secretion
MGKPAARITDSVSHPIPPVLTGGPGSPNVLIGGLPAWRGVPAAVGASIQSVRKATDAVIKSVESVTAGTAGTPAYPAAKAAEDATKASIAIAVGSLISSLAGIADKHFCSTPLPIPPHGPGVVVDGSTSVIINGLPACFLGNTVVEAVGPPNKITMGCPTVLIGTGPAANVSVDTSAISAQIEAKANKAAEEAKQKTQEEQEK